MKHAPDPVRASTTEPIAAASSTIGSIRRAGCASPGNRPDQDAASRFFVDFDPRLVADAAECLSLGLQTRRARPKSFLTPIHISGARRGCLSLGRGGENPTETVNRWQYILRTACPPCREIKSEAEVPVDQAPRSRGSSAEITQAPCSLAQEGRLNSAARVSVIESSHADADDF